MSPREVDKMNGVALSRRLYLDSRNWELQHNTTKENEASLGLMMRPGFNLCSKLRCCCR